MGYLTAINPYSPPQILDEHEEEPNRPPLRSLASSDALDTGVRPECGAQLLLGLYAPSRDGTYQRHAVRRGCLRAFVHRSGVFVRVPPADRCPHVRRTLLIGYGTRLLMSLLFPLGLTLDMFLGVIAVSLVETAMSIPYGSDASRLTFAVVFVTTLVQGVLLNLVLVAYMALIFAVQWGIAHRRAISGGGDGGS